MADRFPTEYCPHCRARVACKWTGNRLNCVSKDHYVRGKFPKRIVATAPEPVTVVKTEKITVTEPVAKPVQLQLFK